jgi:Uma2 family endonuclease
MAAPGVRTRSRTEGQESIPPLENGDRLTREEFERRYEAMPQVTKAELIEGIVYVPSPVRHRQHGQPHISLSGWLVQYQASTPGVEASDNSTVRLDLDNEPQPDALLFIVPQYGGQVRLSEDGYIEGAPELIVEVASSTASYDLNVKLHVYRRNGVREYLVWRVLDQEIDWFALHASQYHRLPLDANGVYRSEVFPGLWLNTEALLRGDLATVLALVQHGVSSPEHAAFVAGLQAHRDNR